MINKAKQVLIAGGSVFDPVSGKSEKADVLIIDGVIKEIGKLDNSSFKGELVSAEECLITPGLIDIHAHLREPGHEDRETLANACEAAMVGGFTEVCSMADTDPVCDKQQIVEFIKKQVKDELVEVYPIAAITKKCQGVEITEMAELKRAGAVAVSDDEHPVLNSAVMRRAMEYASMFDLPVMDHCEDTGLTHRGQINESIMSTRLGFLPMPNAAEEILVSRDIRLAELTGARVHLTKISTAVSVDMVRQAKAAGVDITCDVTAHNLVYSDEDLATFDSNLKVNPPMRRPNDVKALIAGVADGTIDAIVTDHSPYALEEIDVEFDAAPFGMIGLETHLSLLITHLVKPGLLNLQQVLNALTVQPRKILKIEQAVIKAGSKANLTVLDLDGERTIKRESLKSLAQNTPLDGQTLKGVVKCVVNKGKVANF